jgi:hypothetical protein
MDSSHCVAFTRILNAHLGPDAAATDGTPRLEGGTDPPSGSSLGIVVTHAWGPLPRGSDRGVVLERRAELQRKWGVRLERSLAGVLRHVDVAMILSVNGDTHLAQAKPFLAEGVPLFVDKPLANSAVSARALAKLASASRGPLLSCSALRYAEEVERTREEFQRIGSPRCGVVSGPGTEKKGIPGSFFYGVHAAEILHALFGEGIESVRALRSDHEDIVHVQYKDGRRPILRLVRRGASGFWFTVGCAEGERVVPVTAGTFYERLLAQVAAMFRSGRSPMPLESTLEIVALLEAINHSVSKGGAKVRVTP